MSALKSDYVNVDMLYSGLSGGGGSVADRVNDFSNVAGVNINNNAGTSGREGSRFGDNEDARAMCPSLSYKTRLLCFLVGSCVGALFGLFSWITAFTGTRGTFAVIYTFANVFFIGSTFFLCGPIRQIKNMLQLSRIITAVIFVVALILTYIFGAGVHIAWVTILTILIQLVALAWYCLSYIPFARDAVRSFLPCFK